MKARNPHNRSSALLAALLALAPCGFGCAVHDPPVEPASGSVETVAADFSRFVAPGPDGNLTVTLPPGTFSEGSSVTLRAAPGCLWSVPEQTVTPGAEPVKLTVQGPTALALVGKEFKPPLDVMAIALKPSGQSGQRLLRLGPTDEQVAILTAAPPVTDVPRGPKAIAVDGDLSEWSGVPMVNLPYHGRRSDMARFCWLDDGLYMAFDVTDDRVELPERLADTWQADGLELWLETDGARALDITRNVNAHKFAVGPDPASSGGKARAAAVAGTLEGKPSPIDAAWRRTDRGYVLEFRIPASVLAPARLAPGTTIGFHYVLFDDRGHAEDSRGYIPGFFRKPYLWPAMKLVDAEGSNVRN